ncbi:kelch repeat-containing protein [Saccharospirillum mangrovi]|uniref:Kelch repeat-containing protein n=1 Tax=Saccharospirillum mangrovi TaxID=2161747 RepID=UPI000D3D4A59|nr:kelch repeat-containing protein [Saccharospirillum mangrovi]
MLRPNFRFHRTFVWLLLCFALSACVPNPFEFTEPGTARLVTDERFNNPVLSQAGIIEYRSSNTDVATVDANGLVVALAPGQSQITATQTLGERIQSIDYSVEVITRQASLSAWVGPLGSELQLSDGTEGVNLFTTSDANCNPIQFANCANSQSQRLRGGVQRSTSSAAVTLSQPGYVRLQHGEHEWSGMLSADRFVGRYTHTVAAFQGRLWVMGGVDPAPLADIWSSSDGTHWAPHEWLEQPPFEGGSDNYAVVFNDQLWVINTQHGTVWSTIPSPDHDTGFVWQQQGDIGLGYTPRSNSQVIVANNAEGEPRIWLLGGGLRNDVWTFDGTNWQEDRADGDANGFAARSAHQAVAYGGRLWVIGGFADGKMSNDVWSSDDGITWRQDTEHAEFAARVHHRVMAYNDGSGEQLWLVGGQSLQAVRGLNDVWSSRDGIHWTQRQVDADFPPRLAHTLAVFHQQLWVVGGFAPRNLNDAWSTRNGEDWQQHTAEAPFSGRQGHQAVAFDHRLWVIGGTEGGTTNLPSYQNDLWSSSDGLHWQRHLRHAAFSGRWSHQVVAFNQRLWLVGGLDRYGYQSDVWSSADGLHWERLLTQAPFAGRRGHALVVFDQRLWVIGGQSADGNHNDVWSSPNGIDWTEETSAASFTARWGHQVVVFNGQLWLIGGTEETGGGGGTNDIWFSSDGRHWQLRVDEAEFAPRFGHQVVVTQEAGSERLWLVGGGITTTGTDSRNDIWTSRDGVHWRSEPYEDGSRFSGRIGHQALVFNPYLWVIGGADVTKTPKHDIWRSVDGASWQKGLQVDVEFQ